MASVSSTVRASVSPVGYIGDTIADYLGEKEDDLIFKKPLFQQLFSPLNTPYLDWQERSDSMRMSIQSRFDRLARLEKSTWPINGRASYELCDLNEPQLLKMIIKQTPPSQTVVNVVDVGCGEGQWAKNMETFINSQDDLPKGKTIRIISLQAERYSGERTVRSKHCEQIRLGCFQAENFTSELIRCGLGEVTGKIDMLVSSFCLMHLTDPLGSFAQMFDSLRPSSGYLLMDRVHFVSNNSMRNPVMHGDNDGPYAMIQLLLDTKSPFLARLRVGGSWPDFILRRLDNNPCYLPMSYVRGRLGFSYTRETAIENPWKIPLPVPDAYEGTFYGSKSLFDTLQNNGMTGSHPWRPIEAQSASSKASSITE